MKDRIVVATAASNIGMPFDVKYIKRVTKYRLSSLLNTSADAIRHTAIKTLPENMWVLFE
jgi:hypothetical protein